MGYSTTYSLQVNATEKTLRSTKNIADIMAEIEVSTKIDKKKLLCDLAELAAAKTVLVEPEDVIAALREFSEEAQYAINEDGEAEESCKWYDHEKQLIAFSKEQPNWLFTLSGTGEESGDIWKKYFVNGKIQSAKAVITFEDFDERKLK